MVLSRFSGRAARRAAARAAAFASNCATLKGVVSVGTLESILTGMFSRIMPLFHERYPMVDTRLIDSSVEGLKERLDRNMVDLILTLDHSLADTRWVKLFEKKEEIVLVANANHPFASRDKVRLADLPGEDFILMPPKNSYRDLFDQELAKRELSVQPCLEPGQGTVGTLLNVKHLAATPVGMEVRCETKLIEVDRKRLVFEVKAFDACGLIGEGAHERFIVDNQRFMQKAESKMN